MPSNRATKNQAKHTTRRQTILHQAMHTLQAQIQSTVHHTTRPNTNSNRYKVWFLAWASETVGGVLVVTTTTTIYFTTYSGGRNKIPNSQALHVAPAVNGPSLAPTTVATSAHTASASFRLNSGINLGIAVATSNGSFISGGPVAFSNASFGARKFL